MRDDEIDPEWEQRKAELLAEEAREREIHRNYEAHRRAQDAEIDAQAEARILRIVETEQPPADWVPSVVKESPEARADSYSMGVADFFATCDDKIEWLIEPLIAKGTFTIVQGAPKSGKTFFVSWLTAVIAKDKRCVFVEEEGAKEVLRDRLKPFLQPSPRDYNNTLRIIYRKRVRLDVDDSVKALIEACHGASVLVLDPFAALHGKNENAAEEMGPILQQIQAIMSACPGLSVILIHHTKKGATWDKNDTSDAQSSDGRGSGSMAGAADQLINVKSVAAGKRVANEVRFYVENTDTRIGAPFEKRLAAVSLDGGAGSLAWIEEPGEEDKAAELLERIRLFLRPAPDFLGKTKIREGMRVKMNRIQEAVSMGVDMGIFVQSSAGVALKYP